MSLYDTDERETKPLDAQTGLTIAVGALLLGVLVLLGRPYFATALRDGGLISWVAPVIAVIASGDVAWHMWRTGNLRTSSAALTGLCALALLIAVLAWRLS